MLPSQHRNSCAALICTLFLWAGTSLYCQLFPEDLRLTPAITQTLLPDDARIQSGARIGNHTLVVWGSVRKVAPDSVANMLYWQMLRDTVKLGEPQPLTDEGFDPFEFVQVLPMNDRFLIVWNDRRNNTERILSRTISPNGQVGEYEEIATGTSINSGPASSVRLQAKTRLFLNTANQVLVVDMNGVGQVISTRTDTARAPVLDVYWSSKGSSIGAVLHTSGPPDFIDINGNPVKMSEQVQARFKNPFYLDSLFTLYEVKWPDVNVYAYMTDSVPVKTFRIQQIPPDVIRSSIAVLVRPDDTVEVNFGTISIEKFNGAPEAYREIRLNEYAVNETGIPRKILSRDLHSFGSSIQQQNGYASGESSIVFRPCRSLIQKRYILFTRIYEDIHSSRSVRDFYDTLDQAWDLSGNFYWRVYNPSPFELCPIAASVDIERTIVKHQSVVTVSGIASEPITFAASLPPILMNVPETTPFISLQNGELFVGCIQYGNDTIGRSLCWQNKEILSTDSILLNSTWNAFVYSSAIVSGPFAPVLTHTENFMYSLYGLSNGKWFSIHEPTYKLELMSFTVDYDDRELIVSTGRQGYSSLQPISASIYSTSWDSLNHWDSLEIGPARMSLFSFEDSVFVGAVGPDRRIYLFHGTGLTQTISHLDDLNANVFPFYGRTILSCLYSQTQRELKLNRLDKYGDLVNTGTIVDSLLDKIPSHINAIFNPSDSGVVLLYVAQNQLIAASFDKNLNYKERTVVTRQGLDNNRPVGVFRNDTLYVVWEDYRNGAADIYANAIVPNTVLSVANRGSNEEGTLVSVHPNPANHTVRIQLGAIVGQTAKVELWSLLGNRVLENEVGIGRQEINLDVATLPEGAYLLTVETEQKQESRMILISR